MQRLADKGWAKPGTDLHGLTLSRLALASFLAVHFVKVKDAGGKHAGHRYLKGMPSELGGYNIYAGEVAKLKSWLASPTFCPTDNVALRALQHA